MRSSASNNARRRFCNETEPGSSASAARVARLRSSTHANASAPSTSSSQRYGSSPVERPNIGTNTPPHACYVAAATRSRQPNPGRGAGAGTARRPHIDSFRIAGSDSGGRGHRQDGRRPSTLQAGEQLRDASADADLRRIAFPERVVADHSQGNRPEDLHIHDLRHSCASLPYILAS